MRKNKLFLGILAAAMVCGLALSACKNGVQDVKLVQDKLGGVGNLTAVKTTNNDKVIVSWDAVEYSVHYKEVGTKTVKYISGGGGMSSQNDYIYDADGTPSTNTNPDKWSGVLTISGSPLTAGKSYVFGVRASPFPGYVNIISSDIVWSGSVAIPE
jgi:hypothetical protein